MPTSTHVNELKINKLTEAQYDAAVQGGVIGENEISIITDLDSATQVDTMPTAAAAEVGKVYQFIGTTDASYTHGYFYECVSDGQNPATYSWVQTNVQPAPSGLPDQTGQSGKFLTTDGTDASWSNKPLVNTATRVGYGLTIMGIPTTSYYGLNIGRDSTSGSDGSISIGREAKGTGSSAVSIGDYSEAPGRSSSCVGYYSKATGGNSVGLGTYAQATADAAIQLGIGTNSTTNTLQVWTWQLLNKTTGLIPSDRLANSINKYSTMPTAASTNEGWIVQYTGTTDSTYTHGHIYECVSDGGNPATYSWSQVNVQPVPANPLPSTSGASEGQVLTLDSNLQPVWSSPTTSPSTPPVLTGGTGSGAWDSATNTQTVSVTSVTATNTVFVAPAPASASDFAAAGVICTAQGAGTLTFTCTTIPSNNITVNVVIL